MSHARLLQKEDYEIDLHRYEKQGMWFFLFFSVESVPQKIIFIIIIYVFFSTLPIPSQLEQIAVIFSSTKKIDYIFVLNTSYLTAVLNK